LAETAGEIPQTIEHLAKTPGPRKCRRTRRARLADALKVSDEWLGGANIPPSEVSEMPKELALSLSPRLQLAVGAVFRSAAAALHRDMKRPDIKAEAAQHSVGEEVLKRYLWWYLIELIRVDHWRTQLTTGQSIHPEGIPFRPEAPGFLMDFPELRSEAEDRASLGLLGVLELALEPWFKGTARLDYARLRVLVGYDRVGARPGPPHPRYRGMESSPLMMIPQIALGLPE